MSAPEAAGALLALRGVSKQFGDKQALAGVDLDVRGGEVHVVCGENGAGKSTLMNIVGGILQPDEGELLLDGAVVRLPDPVAASRAGVGMVHQHFRLVASMSVAENLYLNRQPKRFGLFCDRAAMRRGAAELIARYGFDLEPDAIVGGLSVGQRQRVEILKALGFDARILILDEPTAVLTPGEVGQLLDVVRDLRAKGRAILFITHKLNEALDISDRVTVLRHGRRISTRPTSELSERSIALDMVGREMSPAKRETPARAQATAALLAAHVTATDARGRRLLDDVSFDIRPGEILGVAGVDGNGQTELSEAAAGLRPLQAGGFAMGGRDVTRLGVRARRRLGLGFIPEDRLDRGVSAQMSVAENVSVGAYARRRLANRAGLVNVAARDAYAAEKIREFDVRGAQPSTPIGSLSGGNIQKVVIARELDLKPVALVVAQPTRGLDVGAAEFVHRQILSAAERGCGVLLISSELTEIFALSDRIAVMFQGRLVGTLERAAATEEAVGLMMGGARAA
jgi:simple sugar transport system ATP-binding protein